MKGQADLREKRGGREGWGEGVPPFSLSWRSPPHPLSLSPPHQLTALFVYRVMESGARIAALAVFASVAGAWLFAVLAGHAAAVVALLAAQAPPRRANGGFGAACGAGGGGVGPATGGAATTAAASGPPKPWCKVFRIVAVPLPSLHRRARVGAPPSSEGLATLSAGASPGGAKGDAATPTKPITARLRAHLPGFKGAGGGGAGDASPDGPGRQPAAGTKSAPSRSFPLALPGSTDAALLAACLAWPPSFYVSDATDRSGAFWWRARMLGRKSCASVAPGTALVPFAPYTALVAGEAAIMLGVAWSRSPPWAAPYVAAAVVLHLLWGLSGALWLTAEVAAASDGGAADAALERAAVGAEAAALAAELAAVEEAVAVGAAGGGGGRDLDLEAGRGGGPPPPPPPWRLLTAGSRKAGRRASEPVGAPGVPPCTPPDGAGGRPTLPAVPSEAAIGAAPSPGRGQRSGSAGRPRSDPGSPRSPAEGGRGPGGGLARPGRYTADGGAADDAVAVGSPAGEA